jgi:hypothetical protein
MEPLDKWADEQVSGMTPEQANQELLRLQGRARDLEWQRVAMSQKVDDLAWQYANAQTDQERQALQTLLDKARAEHQSLVEQRQAAVLAVRTFDPARKRPPVPGFAPGGPAPDEVDWELGLKRLGEKVKPRQRVGNRYCFDKKEKKLVHDLWVTAHSQQVSLSRFTTAVHHYTGEEVNEHTLRGWGRII